MQERTEEGDGIVYHIPIDPEETPVASQAAR